MATVTRLVAALALLVGVAAAAAAAQVLEPEWSRPVGGRTRLVGVEENGRCSVFIDNGAIQVVSPSGQVDWSWRFSSISRYINPREVAISHACDAIAFAGDASYKYVWVVDRDGKSASIKLAVTPADVEFDRDGMLVAVGTYTGSMQLYSRHGALQWERATKARIVQGIQFADDNQRIHFNDWSGSGTVSVAGHVESSRPGTPLPDDNQQERIAVSADQKRMWIRGEDSIDCVDDQGRVLATISVADVRRVEVSRDFSQVLIVREKDLTPVSVEKYVVPSKCSDG